MYTALPSSGMQITGCLRPVCRLVLQPPWKTDRLFSLPSSSAPIIDAVFLDTVTLVQSSALTSGRCWERLLLSQLEPCLGPLSQHQCPAGALRQGAAHSSCLKYLCL